MINVGALYALQRAVAHGSHDVRERLDQHTLRHLRTWHHTAEPQAPANQKMRETFTPLERLALYITERVGSIGFFFIIQIWYIGWIILNSLPHALNFDPGPGYVLLLFISNYIQLTLMPLLMIGQNLQGRHAELRAEDEYAMTRDTHEEVKLSRQELALLRQMVEQLARIEDAVSDDDSDDDSDPTES